MKIVIKNLKWKGCTNLLVTISKISEVLFWGCRTCSFALCMQGVYDNYPLSASTKSSFRTFSNALPFSQPFLGNPINMNGQEVPLLCPHPPHIINYY